MKNVIKKCGLVVLLFLLTNTSIADNIPNGIVNQEEYVARIKKTINIRYDIDFKKSKVVKMSKKEVVAWMKSNSKNKNKSTQKANWKIIEAILAQNGSNIFLFQNLSSKGVKLTEILVAHVSEENFRLFNFSDYIVTNVDESEEIEVEQMCNHLWGYFLDLRGDVNPSEENKRCPCMGESSTDCPSSGNCAEICD